VILKDGNTHQDSVAGHVCDEGMSQPDVAPPVRGTRRNRQHEKTHIALH
jgi:hypothetical protein